MENIDKPPSYLEATRQPVIISEPDEISIQAQPEVRTYTFSHKDRFYARAMFVLCLFMSILHIVILIIDYQRESQQYKFARIMMVYNIGVIVLCLIWSLIFKMFSKSEPIHLENVNCAKFFAVISTWIFLVFSGTTFAEYCENGYCFPTSALQYLAFVPFYIWTVFLIITVMYLFVKKCCYRV